MLKRTLTALLLGTLACAGSLAAQSAPPIVLVPQSLQPSTAQQAAITAALQVQAQHGYALPTDGSPVEVSVSSAGISITYHSAGGPDVTIVLSNGPIFTKPDNKTVWVTNVFISRQLLEISNGF
jgi:hypothetical protein